MLRHVKHFFARTLILFHIFVERLSKKRLEYQTILL